MNKERAFEFASGSTLFENQISPNPRMKAVTKTGCIILNGFIPEALSAVSSFSSENFPKAIKQATSTAIGAAKTTM